MGLLNQARVELGRLHQHVLARVNECHTNKSNLILFSNTLDEWHLDTKVDNK